MSNRTLALLVLAALICVVVANVTAWLFGAFQAVGAGLGAAVIALATWWCRRRALAGVQKSASYWLWMTLPLVLFTVGPIVVRVVLFLTSSEPASLLSFANVVAFLISFALPVSLLALVYLSLSRRASPSSAPAADRSA